MAFYDVLNPVYSCYRYSGDFCKIVKFKRRAAGDGFPSPKEEKSENEKIGERFIASLSRSRSAVLQYALSNEWDYFFTGTINGSWHDRFNLDAFYSRLSQYIRDLRKKYGAQILYLLVAEKHQDGAWHLHGLLKGLPDQSVVPFQLGIHPEKLVKGGYLNWTDYADKFGFCSLGRIRDPIKVAFYISKYITKELGDNIRGRGSHMYFVSRGLKKSEKVGDCYYGSKELDNFLSHDYDFCQVGYGNLRWDLCCEYFDGVDYPEAEKREEVISAPVAVPDACEEWEQMQLNLAGWCNGNIADSYSAAGGSIPSPAPREGRGARNS